MSALEDLLQTHVDAGRIPGAVALVESATGTEVAVVGHQDLARHTPMARDSLFRLASVTKPLVAALVLTLLEEDRLSLGDRVDRWLPEIADAQVVRTPGSAVDDVVPLRRPVTVEDLLTMRAGWGLAPEDLPAVRLLLDRIEHGEPHDPRTPERWLGDLAAVPMAAQPGERWLYNTCSDLQGVLVSRVLDRPLPEVLAERVTDPLGMDDTGFAVPAADEHRLVEPCTQRDGVLAAYDEEPGVWSRPPSFASGSGGLVGTLDDVARFFRMVGAGGTLDGVRVLGETSVRAMTTDQITAEQRAGGGFFLDDQGWGYGGSVDVTPGDPWVVPGRYGWIGGSGTAAYVVPRGGALTVLLTQRALGAPDVLTHAAGS